MSASRPYWVLRQRLARTNPRNQLHRCITSIHGTINGTTCLVEARCNKRSIGVIRCRWARCDVQKSYFCGTTATSNRSSSDGIGGGTESEEPSYPFIPEPTWSIAELGLTPDPEKVPPISDEELQKLCKRALLHFTPEELESSSIRQDLANMMHMINQLQEFHDDNLEGDIDTDMDHVMIYDHVRGVTSAPLRDDPIVTTGGSGDDDAEVVQAKAKEEEYDAHQAKQVWENMLQPKTIRRGGGHEYFSIVTQRNKSSK